MTTPTNFDRALNFMRFLGLAYENVEGTGYTETKRLKRLRKALADVEYGFRWKDAILLRYVIKAIGIEVSNERIAAWLSEARKEEIGVEDEMARNQIKSGAKGSGRWIDEIKDPEQDIVRMALHKEANAPFGGTQYARKMTDAQWWASEE